MAKHKLSAAFVRNITKHGSTATARASILPDVLPT